MAISTVYGMENINSSLYLNHVALYRTEQMCYTCKIHPIGSQIPSHAPLSPFYVQCESISSQKPIFVESYRPVKRLKRSLQPS
jgi:hypothetical protein